MQKKLLLKRCGYVFSGDREKGVYKDIDILISNGFIEKIGKGIEEKEAELIDLSGKVVLPGFVNTHHHSYQALTRAVPSTLNAKLFDWLKELYQLWRWLTPDTVYVGAIVAFSELLLSGCTTTADHFYVFPKGITGELIDYTIQAAKELKIRFHPTRGSMSRGKSKGGLPPDELTQDEETILRDCERLISKYHDSSIGSMLKIGIAPCSPFSVTERLLIESANLARKKGVMLHTHLAETIDEERYCKEVYGMRPLEYMEKVGWLGEDVWFAHGIYFTEEELEKLSKTKTGIAHCPVSNLRLGSGIAPIPEMIERGIKVGLGVDGSASNDSSNMLREIQTCLLIHRIPNPRFTKLTQMEDTVARMDIYTVLELATKGGAKLLGRSDIGEIDVGKCADLAIFNLNHIGYSGAKEYNPIGALLLGIGNMQADTVIVNGEVVVKDGKLTTFDEEKIIELAEKETKKLIEKGHITIL